MELKPMPGDEALQDAFRNKHVRKIVDFLLRETDQDFFEEALSFLKMNFERAPETFEENLQALRDEASRHPDDNSNADTLRVRDEFIQTIAVMYERGQENLKSLRGVIVELLTTKLVSSHCEGGECCNNYGLVDEEHDYKSHQMDVLVFSTSRQQIEAYSCKMNPTRFVNSDRDYLLDLANHGQKRGFSTYLGAVSFDSSGNTLRQLKALHSEEAIHAFGSDNMKELRNNPFIKRL